jgi:hypothetical protein
MVPLIDHLRALLGSNSLSGDEPLRTAADSRAAKLPREHGVCTARPCRMRLPNWPGPRPPNSTRPARRTTWASRSDGEWRNVFGKLASAERAMRVLRSPCSRAVVPAGLASTGNPVQGVGRPRRPPEWLASVRRSPLQWTCGLGNAETLMAGTEGSSEPDCLLASSARILV